MNDFSSSNVYRHVDSTQAYISTTNGSDLGKIIDSFEKVNDHLKELQQEQADNATNPYDYRKMMEKFQALHGRMDEFKREHIDNAGSFDYDIAAKVLKDLSKTADELFQYRLGDIEEGNQILRDLLHISKWVENNEDLRDRLSKIIKDVTKRYSDFDDRPNDIKAQEGNQTLRDLTHIRNEMGDNKDLRERIDRVINILTERYSGQ